MVLAYSSGGLVREVRGELADVGGRGWGHRAEALRRDGGGTLRPLRPRGGAHLAHLSSSAPQLASAVFVHLE